jgi:hypothetical protein
MEIGSQAVQISVTTAVFSILPEARARLNAAIVISVREFHHFFHVNTLNGLSYRFLL